MAEIQPNQNSTEPRARPAIRTMKSDVEELFKTTKPSLINIVSQEARAASARLPETNKKSGAVGYIIGGFVAAAVVGGGFWYFYSQENTTPARPAVQKLISPFPFFAIETSRSASVDSQNPGSLEQLFDDTAKEIERAGTIKRILVTVQDGPQERFLTLADFFRFYHMNPPSNFLGPITVPLMTFIYYGHDGSRFGLAVPTTDSNRTLASMIQWETSVYINLRALFFGAQPDVGSASFEDRTYRNIDWRYLKLSSSKDFGIAYVVYPAKNMLVITTSKDAMETVINRLLDSR